MVQPESPPMPLRFIAALIFGFAGLLPAFAETATPADVSKALRMADMIRILEDEGRAYGDDLEEQLFPAAPGDRWDRVVQGIYDAGRVQARFETAFERRLGTDPEQLDAIMAFFASDRGGRILTLELAAREALLDDGVEEATAAKVADMRAAHDPRLGLLERFARANDLIDQNVSGSMNANLAFYRGMAAGGAFGADAMTEDDMLSDVWAQEPDIRAETEGWLYPFMALAYGPLSDDDMQAYLAFSETPAAQLLNSAMFGAYDEIFSGISADLGRAAAEVLAGQDI